MKKLYWTAGAALLTLVFGAIQPAQASGWFDSCFDDRGRIKAEGSWLYWTPAEDNFNYASYGDLTPVSPDGIIISAQPLIPNFQPSNGFRLALAYEIPCSQWEVSARYTHLPANAKRSQSAQSIFLNGSTFPIFNVISSNQQAFQSIESSWHMRDSYLDIELAREINCWQCFRFRPHLGVRSYWFHQKLALALSGVQQNGDLAIAESTQSQRLFGCGVVGGIGTEWEVGYGFSLIGDLGGSLLYSNSTINLEVNQRIFNTGGLSRIDALTVKDRARRGNPSFDYRIGVQYQSCWGDFLYALSLSWEQHYIVNLNQLTSGAVSLQGLTLNAGVAY